MNDSNPFRHKQYDCSEIPIEELREEAALEYDVPGVDLLNAEELCAIIDERITQLYANDKCDNEDEESIDGTMISQIPEYLKYSVKAKNKKTYCYHLVDLYKEISNGAKRDHFNRFEFDASLKQKIIDRYNLLSRILTSKALNDALGTSASAPEVHQDQPLIDLWAKLYYPGLTIEEFKHLSKPEYTEFLWFLEKNGLEAKMKEKRNYKALVQGMLEANSSEYNIMFEYATREYAQRFHQDQMNSLHFRVDRFHTRLMTYLKSGTFLAITRIEIESLSVNSLLHLYTFMEIEPPALEKNVYNLLSHLMRNINRDNASIFLTWSNAKYNTAQYLKLLKDWLNSVKTWKILIRKLNSTDVLMDSVWKNLQYTQEEVDNKLEIGELGTMVKHLIQHHSREHIIKEIQLYTYGEADD
jgi:hypothetical protein